jgi:hypothetical protein
MRRLDVWTYWTWSIEDGTGVAHSPQCHRLGRSAHKPMDKLFHTNSLVTTDEAWWRVGMVESPWVVISSLSWFYLVSCFEQHPSLLKLMSNGLDQRGLSPTPQGQSLNQGGSGPHHHHLYNGHVNQGLPLLEIEHLLRESDPLWRHSGRMHHCLPHLPPLCRCRLQFMFNLRPYDMEPLHSLLELRLKIYNVSPSFDPASRNPRWSRT